MAKFKVGDKVKIVGNPSGIGPKMMGQVCTIERSQYHETGELYHCRGAGCESWWYPESSLQDATAFEPADYLRKILARNEELEAQVISLEARLASVKAALA